MGPSAAWAGAWIFVLSGNWDHAEALLYEAHKGRLREPTLLALLALCQARRGKLQSAIFNARLACSPQPPNKEYAKLLISLLLDAGLLCEAQERLDKLAAEHRSDTELMFSMLRLQLMSRKIDDADKWAALYRERSKGAHTLVLLGIQYEAARKYERAADYFNLALVDGHYPEALLGLARFEADRKNKQLAEQLLLTALNIEKAPSEGGASALQVFHHTLSQLLMLQEPVPNCSGWVASFNGGSGPAALAHQSFLIFASSRQEAEQHLNKLLIAMQPGVPPIAHSTIGWREAPKEQQPLGPVRAGIQGVVVSRAVSNVRNRKSGGGQPHSTTLARCLSPS